MRHGSAGKLRSGEINAILELSYAAGLTADPSFVFRDHLFARALKSEGAGGAFEEGPVRHGSAGRLRSGEINAILELSCRTRIPQNGRRAKRGLNGQQRTHVSNEEWRIARTKLGPGLEKGRGGGGGGGGAP